MPAYIAQAFQESELYKWTLACSTREQLENRKRYTLLAIDFHTKARNTEQVLFFTENLKLINKRLKLKRFRN